MTERWRNSQYRPLGETRIYRQRRQRAWLVLGAAICLVLTIEAAKRLLG